MILACMLERGQNVGFLFLTKLGYALVFYPEKALIHFFFAGEA